MRFDNAMRQGLVLGCLTLMFASAALAGEPFIPEFVESAKPLASPHFPDRLHEFVWRNWNLVEPALLARIVHATEEQVTAIAQSMGLPSAPTIPSSMRTRGYITLIRRNWHLLPYDQLMELVGMSPERLAFTLREDDFLWIKLGQVKPRCEPIHYRAPDEPTRRRAADIRQIVETEFGARLGLPEEARFDFVRQLSEPLASPIASTQPSESASRCVPPVSLRFVYSYLAVYGDPLSDPTVDPYPDGFLERLAAVGVNGVWLHSVLRDLAPGGTTFPEFGVGHAPRLANLRALVGRARKYGIGVYLYMNEPRAMPTAFFETRSDLGGVQEGEFRALCTSRPAVREWMADALTHVFREVPDLGGVYAITASENLTNCASHGAWGTCPHCERRSDADILAEVVSTIEAGVHRGNARANVVVSDWGWRGHGDAVEIIERLPKSVWLMSVSEWDKPIDRGGIVSKVGEYAISAVGPGPRSVRHWAAARNAGIKTAAEIQFNNTCEIASIPYLPVMDLVAEHLEQLAPSQLNGMLIGWTMGGHPSPNFQLAREMNRSPTPNVEEVLGALARDRFGAGGAAHVRKAWSLFSDAYREYPFHVSVVYAAPVQHGPANPLYATKTGYSATMWGIPYDDLNGWRGPYPPDVFASQFERMAEGWSLGVAELRAAVENTPPDRRGDAQSDLRYARAAGIHFQSVANQARFVMARDALADPAGSLSMAERDQLRKAIRLRLESEISLARDLHALVQEDSRIGFEPSCHYFYVPLDLVEKTINCRWLMEHMD